MDEAATEDGRPANSTATEQVKQGLSGEELLKELNLWIEQSQSYARHNKQSFRWRASALRILSLTLSAAATIILGLQNLSFWPGLAFGLVSILTVLGAVEPFFAWRSRWVLLEEAQYRFHRLSDMIKYELAAATPDSITRQIADKHFETYTNIWQELSLQWLEHRKHDKSTG